MRKPFGDFKAFTSDEIKPMIVNEFLDIIRSLASSKDHKIIDDILLKKEINFVQLFADMYVSTYKIQHELNNIQQMIKERNDELNKLLDLYDKTLNLVINKMNEDEY